MYNTIDDFVMTNLKTYAGRPIKTAEAEDIDLGDDAGKEGDKGAAAAAAGLSTEDAEDLCSWLKESALTDKVRSSCLGCIYPSYGDCLCSGTKCVDFRVHDAGSG